MTKRELFIEIVKGHIGTPYQWGGDDPTGLDCSGLINIAAQVVGVLGQKEDRTAEGWYQHSTQAGIEPGNLIFYKNATGKVFHVEMLFAIVDGIVYSIGASGGGSSIHTLADAVAKNAFVKVHEARAGFETRSIFV